MSTAPTPLWRAILTDLLFATLVILYAAGRFIARQVLARLAYAVLLLLACVLLTDAERGERQADYDHA